MNFFDLHCDTATKCVDMNCNLSSDTMVSLDKRGKIDKWVQMFAIFLYSNQTDELARIEYLRYLKGFMAILEAENERISLCKNIEEIKKAHSVGKCAAILTIENGAALGGQLENIALAADDGVKAIAITWNGENALGFGSDVGGHLKPFGREAVIEMINQGIVPDISHLSDEGADDVFCLTDNPIIATHSNLKKVCSHCRNLNDGQFKEIVRRKGLVGINLCTKFLDEASNVTWDTFFRHVDAMLELGGENTIAFGSDFDGADMPDICRNLGDIPTVYGQFKSRYGTEQANKIFFQNAQDFFSRAF
ncbi:MAG: membrane dipeptidase [Oscillospiraceae bacterium]